MSRLGALYIVILLVGCSTDELTSERIPTSNRSEDQRSDRKGEPDGGDDGQGEDENNEEGGETAGDDEGSVNGNDDGGEEPGETNPAANLTFFEDQVLPRFASACAGCHADPRFMVEVRGPLTIFAYDRMQPLVLQGDSAVNNALVNKIQGISQHVGGDRCLSGLGAAPCDVVVEWAKLERGESTRPGDTPSVRIGELVSVSDMGRVVGWAVDSADTTATTMVRFYIDGPAGTGTQVAEVAADLTGFDGGNGNRHAFAATLPETYRNGEEFTLYVYGMSNGQEIQLPGSPKTFNAYAFSDGGRTFFNNTIMQPLVNRCGGCHAISYEQQFANLLQPSPAKGGTALNNLLLNKPSGRAEHGGGNLCGGANGAPCDLIQDWWDLEFN